MFCSFVVVSKIGKSKLTNICSVQSPIRNEVEVGLAINKINVFGFSAVIFDMKTDGIDSLIWDLCYFHNFTPTAFSLASSHLESFRVIKARCR